MVTTCKYAHVVGSMKLEVLGYNWTGWLKTSMASKSMILHSRIVDVKLHDDV